jgi:hypothetical protein
VSTTGTESKTGARTLNSSLGQRWLLFMQTAAIITAAVCFMACGNNDPVEKKLNTPAIDYQAKRLALYNDSVFPKAKAIIRSGDMITRLGTDITSEMIRQLNQSDQSFSHCGIANIEHDTIFVYHAIGGEFNPDQKLKRESLYTFCHPSENKAIGVFHMEMDTTDNHSLINIIQSAYSKGILFDMKFDYTTDDRLYCAEFVSKSYSNAIKDSNWFNFSVRKTFKYVAVDNLFLNKLMIKRIHFTY